MSEVERWAKVPLHDGLKEYSEMQLRKDGAWVKFSDYDALRTELEGVKAELFDKNILIEALRIELKTAWDSVASVANQRDELVKALEEVMDVNAGALPSEWWIDTDALLTRIKDQP
jgi:hypothetical protein